MLIRWLLHGLVLGGSAIGAWWGGGIAGTKHDFSREGWSEGQICLPCHAPHNAEPPGPAPLWDRGASATESYTLYGGARGMPHAGSLACLSCHDGSTAIDAYGGMQGKMLIQARSGGRTRIGAEHDLNTDHPVGVRYPENRRGFKPVVQVLAAGEVVLPNGYVECISCHDVHNQYGGAFFLVKSNARSGLCLSCHNK
ncbi:MAG: cytochrome c3 family protein [Phycisphaerae bacterium]